MNRELVRKVCQRAGNRCEYCLIPPVCVSVAVSNRSHPGRKARWQVRREQSRLGLSSLQSVKGPNIAGCDPDSSQPGIRLFHPRSDIWGDHFRFDGARIVGQTPTGRATVHVLAMNAGDSLLIRPSSVKRATCSSCQACSEISSQESSGSPFLHP